MIKRNKLILFGISLFIISFIVILINGRTYTYKIRINENIDVEKLNIEIKDDIIKIVDKKINDNYLELKLKSIKKGKTFIETSYKDNTFLESFYVHNYGIITENSYFGRSSSDIIIPMSISFYIVFILTYLIKKYKYNLSINMYQYKNIKYLGIIIFLIFMLFDELLQLCNYNGLIESIKRIITSVDSFSIILFPIAVIVSIFVIISNIKLLKREGFTWKNMLGIILGIIIIISTLLPEFLYNYLYSSKIFDIHNQKSITLYIYEFIKTFIYACVSYLECILVATIILSIKAAKHIPKYDKDFILILGCMVKKDGTLTPLLKGRVDRTIEFAKMQKEKTNKDIVFVPSGGQGVDEVISEADAIKNYLIDQGINKKKILVENKSTSTYENIKFSYKIIKKQNNNPNIALSTTNYHVFRACSIAFKEGLNIEGIGSKTKSYFWINAFIREFIATLYIEKIGHIKIIVIVMIFSIIMILLNYISNIY